MSRKVAGIKYHVIKFQTPFEKVKYFSKSPEIMLYKSIILQAIIDATNTSPSKSQMTLEKEAKDWIFKENQDFNNICDMADLHPEYVRKITLQVIKLKFAKEELNMANIL